MQPVQLPKDVRGQVGHRGGGRWGEARAARQGAVRPVEDCGTGSRQAVIQVGHQKPQQVGVVPEPSGTVTHVPGAGVGSSLGVQGGAWDAALGVSWRLV